MSMRKRITNADSYRNSQEGSLSSTTQLKEGGDVVDEKDDNERVKVNNVPDNPAYVKYEAGSTLYLGNYNSARVSVSISLPVEGGIADYHIEQSYLRARGFVDQKIEEELKEISKLG